MATQPLGFQSPGSIISSLPQVFLKWATFGYYDDLASTLNTTVDAIANATADNSTAAAAADAAASDPTTMENIRGFGNVFIYVTSKWALLCVFMVKSHLHVRHPPFVLNGHASRCCSTEP